MRQLRVLRIECGGRLRAFVCVIGWVPLRELNSTIASVRFTSFFEVLDN